MGAATIASAQYVGNVGDQEQTGAHALQDILELQPRGIESVGNNHASGSGTSYFDALGAAGASVIVCAVLGGTAGAFFIKSRSGKYAAMGRG